MILDFLNFSAPVYEALTSLSFVNIVTNRMEQIMHAQKTSNVTQWQVGLKSYK